MNACIARVIKVTELHSLLLGLLTHTQTDACRTFSCVRFEWKHNSVHDEENVDLSPKV